MTAIALFGGSGRTGLQIVEAAARRAVPVRASTRRPGSIRMVGSVTEGVGSVTDSAHVGRMLQGATAACIVFGPRPPYSDIFCAEATRLIVAEARRAGVERVVCQTGAMIGSYPRNRSRAFDLMARLYQSRQPEPHRDRVEQERAILESELDWLLLKPPRLRDAGTAGDLRIGPDVRVGLLSSVSRSDLADLVVEEVLEPRFRRAVVFVRG